MQFDNLHLEHFAGTIEHIYFKTYLYIRPGACIHSSFTRPALWEFGVKLREMADDCLRLEHPKAKLAFVLYIKHGDEPRIPRTDFSPPTFSVSFLPNDRGNRVVLDFRFVQEEFIRCARDKGCQRCRVVKED
jgi:hypothetical protein